MAKLSNAQVMALGRKHGFSDAELPDLVAVTVTESGNVTDRAQGGGKGRGLVQIDLGQHPGVTEAQAFDADFAMAFARRLSRNGKGLGAPNWYGPRDHPAEAEAARRDARQVLATDPQLATAGDPGKGDPSLVEQVFPLAGVIGDAIGGGGGVAGITAGAIAGALKLLIPWSLVRRLAMIIGGAGMVLIGALALGVDLTRIGALAGRVATVKGATGAGG